MADTASTPGYREIVIAVVAPIGSPMDRVASTLTAELASHGYKVGDVRISDLLDTAEPTRREDADVSRWRRLMNKGDAFRERVGDDAACAYLASQAINLARKAATGDVAKHRPKFVNLVRSLKTAGEVHVLRQIYGQRVVVLGVSASLDVRRNEIQKALRREMKNVEAAGEAAYLLNRDDEDETKPYGQRVRDAFRLCDAYLPAASASEQAEVQRVVSLLLGEPWRTPTRDELGMFHAWSTKFRSSAAGRQVGAAIVDDDGEVVALGCNDVPKPRGGQYWEGDTDDRRDFKLGVDANDRWKFETVRELLEELARAGWLSDSASARPPDDRAIEALTSGPLRGSRVGDLLEFGRIVHAEMAALLTAARKGLSVRDCTLYTTTYPCHECARLIIGAGITRVLFIDPYPKSLAPELFETMFGGSARDTGVVVVPFTGVSPRIFPRVFEMANRTKDAQGTYASWTDRVLRVQDEELADSIPLQEAAAGKYLATRLKIAADRAAADTPASESAEGDGIVPSEADS